MEGSDNEYNRTTHATSTAGASFTFTFVGVSVIVFGTLGVDNLPNTTYVLDSTEPIAYSGKPSTNVQYQQIFYQSPILPNSTHTLVGNVADQGSSVWIDFFVVATPSAGEAQSESPTSSQSVVVVTTTVSADNFKSSSSNSPAGPVTGGVIGGIALAVMIVALLWWFRRRNSAARSFDPYPLHQPSMTMGTARATNPLANSDPMPLPSEIAGNTSTSTTRALTRLKPIYTFGAGTIPVSTPFQTSPSQGPSAGVYSTTSTAEVWSTSSARLSTTRSAMADIDSPPPAYN